MFQRLSSFLTDLCTVLLLKSIEVDEEMPNIKMSKRMQCLYFTYLVLYVY